MTNLSVRKPHSPMVAAVLAVLAAGCVPQADDGSDGQSSADITSARLPMDASSSTTRHVKLTKSSPVFAIDSTCGDGTYGGPRCEYHFTYRFSDATKTKAHGLPKQTIDSTYAVQTLVSEEWNWLTSLTGDCPTPRRIGWSYSTDPGSDPAGQFNQYTGAIVSPGVYRILLHRDDMLSASNFDPLEFDLDIMVSPSFAVPASNNNAPHWSELHGSVSRSTFTVIDPLNGVTTESIEPVISATIELIDHGNRQQGIGKTDMSGQFVIYDRPAGDYTLELYENDTRNLLYSAPISITGASSQTLDDIVL